MDEESFMGKFSKVLPFIYVLIVSMWAGTAHTIGRVRKGELAKFSFVEWVADIVICSFIGMITYFICRYGKLDEFLTITFVSIASHMGTRAINLFEKLFIAKIERIIFNDNSVIKSDDFKNNDDKTAFNNYNDDEYSPFKRKKRKKQELDEYTDDDELPRPPRE